MGLRSIAAQATMSASPPIASKLCPPRDARSADFVDIMEPAPTVAPVMDRQFVRETAQEMVIADQGRSAPNADSPSPFDNMQVSAMQNGGIPGSRSMEDTVAELLRPMLRSWLAENMPKIVERALRKEIDDSIHSEHKTAAE